MLSPLSLIYEMQREIWHMHKEGNMKMEQRFEDAGPEDWSEHKPRNANSHRKLEGKRNLFSPRTSGGSTAPQTLGFQGGADFGLLASRTQRMNFCCFKPPSVWYSRAIGN